MLDLLTHPSGTLRAQLVQNQNLGQDLAGKQLAHWAGWREGRKAEGESSANGNGVEAARENGNGHV